MQSAKQIYRSSAPGKIILCGEYSVLDGWPALVMASDRRFSASLKMQVESELHKPSLRVVTRGLQNHTEQIWLDTHGKFSCKQSSPLGMLVYVLNELIQTNQALDYFRHQSWEITCDSSVLFEGDSKLGLGSSAALTVAVAGLVFALCEKKIPANEILWDTLQRIHSAAQGKRGSGADLAASIAGGFHQFTNRIDRHVELLPWVKPNDIHLSFLWSGQSASTPKFLNALSSWKQKNQGRFDVSMKELGVHSRAVCNSKKAADFINKLGLFTDSLFEFDKAAGIGVFSGGHDTLFEQAKKVSDIRYKPCGAGGGDLGMVISQDVDALNAFVSFAEKTGFKLVHIESSNSGLTIHSEAYSDSRSETRFKQ